MAGLCEGGNEPPGSLKATSECEKVAFTKFRHSTIVQAAMYLVTEKGVYKQFHTNQDDYSLIKFRIGSCLTQYSLLTGHPSPSLYQGWTPGANPDSKRGRLIFIHYGINAVRCSAGKKDIEEESYGSP
ncbi:hypothetical protein ANN_05108 [Periplaneta americana]|uniref:Uncharacterized protein n=1 Tax=Periplaneta americana TaxID=6978 RepID=A0ABQ8TAB9_PERAM|nr:hypothetical protein ANN_05108 [Periplaneta americana]